VVQSIVESPEPRLPELDGNGDPFTPAFHDFIGRCLKKEVMVALSPRLMFGADSRPLAQPSERASVEELLESPWLRLHDATDTERCVRRCASWLQRLKLAREDASEAKECAQNCRHDAKELKSKQDDEEEIEETIEVDEGVE
jgi:hypothetical protein